MADYGKVFTESIENPDKFWAKPLKALTGTRSMSTYSTPQIHHFTAGLPVAR